MAGTPMGAVIAGISRRLKQQGVDPKIIAAVVSQAGKQKRPVRLSASNRSRINELLVEEGDRCVLVLSKNRKVRVVSYDGHQTHREQGHKLGEARRHGGTASEAAPA